VKKGSIELMSTATQLSASSKEQESSMDAFGSSTTQIVAAVKEISATSDELLHTMEEVTHVASAAAATAQAGSAGLARMDANMGQLSKATASISAKLSSIRERASEVNVVITTITKVADQTNLLSVNAAIEAEKAGESGRGFLVLAREIRRLADQTAVATLDIERIVKDVQGAVSAGVMEMDKFSQEVRQCTAAVAEIGAQIGSFIGQVQALSDRFTQVADGMRSQSQGARQINDAMVHLAEGARQSNAAVKEVGSAAHSMRDAVDGLKQEIARFKLAG
jgi:methyl-accepting chemotaxis protein WspA